MRQVTWKNGAKCAVSLTFDVDGESAFLAMDPANAKRRGLLSQGTYGPRVGVPLILDLLERYGVKATFFVPGWTADHHTAAIESIYQAGHEIGHHGYLHEPPRSEAPEREWEMLLKGTEALQRITGERPVGYRSPSWEFTDNSLSFLQKEGFLYSSNMMDDFVPYVHPEGLVELPVQWLLDDAPFFFFRPGGGRPIWPAHLAMSAWKEEFHGIYRYGGLFNLTMHPFVIGRPGRLMMLEQLIQTILSYPDVWVAPLREIAQYWKTKQA